jgi:hypothetical protein
MTPNGDDRFSVDDPRFDARGDGFESARTQADADYGETGESTRRRGPWTTCLIGCLVIFVVGLVLLALVGYWVWQNWRDLAATGAAEAMSQMIDETDLPPQERQEMKAEVRRVAEAFREGKMSNEQFMRLVAEVAESPLMTLFVVSALEQQYLGRSDLSEEEKAEGRRTLQRFVRGSADGQIGQEGVDAVLEHVAQRQPDGSWRLRDRVTDEELRAALAEAKGQADDANVPEQPEEFDASTEFKQIVDRALGEELGAAPAVDDESAEDLPAE